MTNLLKMMKQAGSMRREMKRIQEELARRKVEAESPDGMVKVVARGDMSIQSIDIDPTMIDRDASDRLEELVKQAVNGALQKAKKDAGSEMSKLTAGMGVGDLLGI